TVFGFDPKQLKYALASSAKALVQNFAKNGKQSLVCDIEKDVLMKLTTTLVKIQKHQGVYRKLEHLETKKVLLVIK
ncbi:unnamed protein product, partial [Ceratitis capitata]